MSLEVVTIGNATPRITAIYALCERDSMAPRYVGKTVQYIIDRFNAHKREAARGGDRPVLRWLRKRVPLGGAALMLLEHVPPNGDWASRESYWIDKFRAQGHKMLNLTDGGEGLAGHVFSKEHREKIAAAHRSGAHIACLQCGASAWRKKNQITKGADKFCSRACYAASLKGVSRPMPPGMRELGVLAAAEKRRAQTHCKRGHSLSGDNVFATSHGSRGCKTCRRMHKAAYLERKHG